MLNQGCIESQHLLCSYWEGQFFTHRAQLLPTTMYQYVFKSSQLFCCLHVVSTQSDPAVILSTACFVTIGGFIVCVFAHHIYNTHRQDRRTEQCATGHDMHVNTMGNKRNNHQTSHIRNMAFN